jgi:hypothetical protein
MIEILITDVIELNKRVKELEEALSFYADPKLYFDRPTKVNFQQGTAIFHIDNPELLSTEWETTTPEVSVKLKVDRGQVAKKALEKK